MINILTPSHKNAKVFLWDTIYNKLISETNLKYWEIDVRCLEPLINKYPELFPKFIRSGNYTPYFNEKKSRWEVVKGFKEIKFNKNNFCN